MQTDGTAHGPHMSCSYADIVMAKYDSLTNNFHLKPSVWKRFRDDIFVLCEDGTVSLFSFLDYLNSVDKTSKIKFTMKIAGLEFLDLKLKISEGKEELMSMINQPIVLAIPHPTPAIQNTTYATYLPV